MSKWNHRIGGKDLTTKLHCMLSTTGVDFLLAGGRNKLSALCRDVKGNWIIHSSVVTIIGSL